jgi:hypothetical protein
VVNRLVQGRAHHSRERHHDVETRVVSHLDQRRDAASGLAHEPGRRAAVFDFRRCVRPVAALVLQALDEEGIARAVGQRTRHEEAGDAFGKAREGEERVAHRRRAEPFVAVEAKGVPVAARLRLHGPQVGAALLLGHRHADRRARFFVEGDGTRIVGVGEHPGPPHPRDVGCVREDRDRGEGHGHRAGGPLLQLVPQVEERRARGKAARLALPRHRVQAGAQRAVHQVMVGDVVLDLVDAPPEAVVRAQFRQVAIGERGMGLGLGGGDELPQVARRSRDPRHARAANRGLEPGIGRIGVVALEGRRLVEDFVVHRALRPRSCTHSTSASSAGCAALALAWLMIITTIQRRASRSST